MRRLALLGALMLPGVAHAQLFGGGLGADTLHGAAPFGNPIADDRVYNRHHGAIQYAAKQFNVSFAEPATNTVSPSPITLRMTTAQRRSQDAYGRRRSRYEEAARLRAAGISISAIATALGAERKTIRRWLRAGGAPLWSKPPRTGILTPYQAHLERRWAEGCHNASLLWREVAELGFTGRPGVVLQWAKARREQTSRVRKREVISIPSGCSLARLVMADPEVLPKAERKPRSPPAGPGSTVGRCDHRGEATEHPVAPERIRKPQCSFGGGRPHAVEGVCRRPAPRHRRHPSGARPAMDHEPRGGTGKPPENAEADHVWPCRVPAPACPRP